MEELLAIFNQATGGLEILNPGAFSSHSIDVKIKAIPCVFVGGNAGKVSDIGFSKSLPFCVCNILFLYLALLLYTHIKIDR